jgi:hypothetical protein
MERTMMKKFLSGVLIAASTLSAIAGSAALQRQAFYEGYTPQQLDCLTHSDMSQRHCGMR